MANADDKQGFQKTGSSESLGIVELPPEPKPETKPDQPQDK